MTDFPLGFGTSSLARNSTMRGARSNLDTAFEEGVTHYDTAPAYCFGHAEMMLGKFLQGRRDKVTVSTKYGITPRRIPFALLPAFNLVRKPLKKALGLAVKLSGSKHHHTFSYTTTLDPQKLEDSLNNSLREMKTDYVDNFMLHRIDSSLANQEDAVAMLLKARDAGKLRRLGMAGSYADIYEGEPLRPEYTAIQFGDHGDEGLSKQIDDPYAEERVYYRFGLFTLMGAAKAFLTEHHSTTRSDGALPVSRVAQVRPAALCVAYFKRNRELGYTLFSSSKNRNIRDTIRLWREDEPGAVALLDDFRDYLTRQPAEV